MFVPFRFQGTSGSLVKEMKDGKAVLEGMAGITGINEHINAGQGSYSVLS